MAGCIRGATTRRPRTRWNCAGPNVPRLRSRLPLRAGEVTLKPAARGGSPRISSDRRPVVHVAMAAVLAGIVAIVVIGPLVLLTPARRAPAGRRLAGRARRAASARPDA